MISFRLSEEEYARVREMSLAEQARSVSDYARAALCRLPAEGNVISPGAQDPRIEGLEGDIRQLKSDLQQLRQRIEHTLGRANVA